MNARAGPLAGVLVSAMLSFTPHAVARADVVAVVSVKCKVDHLSKKELADIFLGRTTRFPDGEAVVPIDQDAGAADRDQFDAEFLDKDPAQMIAYWSKIIFTGRGKPPETVANGLEARKAVAANSHAITYIDRRLLDSDVKPLRVE